MPSITFVQYDGTQHVVQAPVGQSVMQAALDNLVPGILGDCGGSCACATCHGYVDDAWRDKIPESSDDEQSLLEVVIDPTDASRLTCQIIVTPALDGAVIRLPRSQT